MKSYRNIPASFLMVFMAWQSLQAADDTADLRKLKASYSAASERALAPIKATYKRELERLRDAYVKDGKLEAAIAVKEELESLVGSAVDGATASGSSPKGDGPSKREIEKSLISGQWIFFKKGTSEEEKGKFDHEVEFKKDGKASRKDNKSESRWEVTKNGELLFMVDSPLWACRLKRKSDSSWAGVGTGTNAPDMQFVHLEKRAP